MFTQISKKQTNKQTSKPTNQQNKPTKQASNEHARYKHNHVRMGDECLKFKVIYTGLVKAVRDLTDPSSKVDTPVVFATTTSLETSMFCA